MCSAGASLTLHIPSPSLLMPFGLSLSHSPLHSVGKLPGDSPNGQHQSLVTYVDFIYDGKGTSSTVPLFTKLPEIWRIISIGSGPVPTVLPVLCQHPPIHTHSLC